MEKKFIVVPEIDPGTVTEEEIKYQISNETGNGLYRIDAEIDTGPFYEGIRSKYLWVSKIGLITDSMPSPYGDWLESHDYHWGKSDGLDYIDLMDYDLLLVESFSLNDDLVSNLETFLYMGNRLLFVGDILPGQEQLEKLIGIKDVEDLVNLPISGIEFVPSGDPHILGLNLDSLRDEFEEVSLRRVQASDAKILYYASFIQDGVRYKVPLITRHKIESGDALYFNLKSVEPEHHVPHATNVLVDFLLNSMYKEKQFENSS